VYAQVVYVHSAGKLIQQYLISSLQGEIMVILQQNLTQHHHISTGVPLYLLIQYPLFIAAGKKTGKVKQINGS
jgi:hypothetical protein